MGFKMDSDTYIIAHYFQKLNTHSHNFGKNGSFPQSGDGDQGYLDVAADLVNVVLESVFDAAPVGTGIMHKAYSMIKADVISLAEKVGLKDYEFLSSEDLKALRDLNRMVGEFCTNDIWRRVYYYYDMVDEKDRDSWKRILVEIVSDLREAAIKVDEINLDIFVFVCRIGYAPNTNPTSSLAYTKAVSDIRGNEFERMKKLLPSLSEKIESVRVNIHGTIESLLLHITGKEITDQGFGMAEIAQFQTPSQMGFEQELMTKSNTDVILKYMTRRPPTKDEIELEFQRKIDERKDRLQKTTQFSEGNSLYSRTEFQTQRKAYAASKADREIVKQMDNSEIKSLGTGTNAETGRKTSTRNVYKFPNFFN